ncbi:U-box domain-containing protein 52-like [Euphorbia lathyris]|uniref:U-box domain-containing protein 52-like n=1 Tax=Euphorbia lathyris TaxID=212925 RepID=UPI00331334A6
MVRKGAEKGDQSVAIAIDKDKGSQHALKWAVDQFLSRGQSVTFLHVKQISSKADANEEMSKRVDAEARELFLPFRCFCTRKDIKCIEVQVEDVDIAKGIVEFVNKNSIENLVLGAASKGGIIPRKFKGTDVPTTVVKTAPDFCTVYVINKTKVSSVKTATASAPIKLQPQPQPIPQQLQSLTSTASVDLARPSPTFRASDIRPNFAQSLQLEDLNSIRSPFSRRGNKYEPPATELDISFVSSGRPSMFASFHDSESGFMTPPKTSSVDFDMRSSFASAFSPRMSIDSSQYSFQDSVHSGQTSRSSDMDDVEAEMRRLRLELKQTMEMYNSACKEARSAKQKSNDYHRWKYEEQQRFEESRVAEEAAMALVEKEKAKTRAAIEAAQAAQRLAELEAQKRKNVEMRYLMESKEANKGRDSWIPSELRYRRYTIEEIEEATNYFSDQLKIGEGGYGPVYKAYLDHTEVAIKVLRPDAAQGKSQFQQEVEVLSCIRHPNMVLLLGACPEYGCLVYEHMANGSLDDCLFGRGKSPPLPWQIRFRIAAEIATGLLFLHQTKPEALVHRDLKPGNILLDRNFVSKIGDVGLARLVPPSIANAVTQYRMTSTAGTFCYIDPEYQQTGMLGTKSDIYSFGILLLQIITAKSPMGLAHLVETAIDEGTFAYILDPAVPDWPYDETLKFANIALQCAELRKKDRPDLGKVVLPEFNRLRDFGEQRMPFAMYGGVFGSNMHHVSSIHEMTMSGIASDVSSVSSA